jgi:anti-sigma-K factor RskA
MAGGRQFNWLALVAGLALVLAGTGLIRAVRNRDQLRTAAAAQQASFMSQMTVLQRAIASRDSLIASLTGPNMKVVDLLNYASQELLARMFWDQKTQEWTMYAYNLRQPKSGKVFQVWLFTNAKAQPVSAGTFTPDAHGSAVLRAKYPLSRSGLQKISVSEEPQGGATSPTGPIVMTGSGT